MKLVTFAKGAGAPRIGAVLEDSIVDFAADDGGEAFRDMLSLIRAGADALERARALVSVARTTLPMAGLRLLPPLPVPEQVRCFSVFEAHCRNSAAAMLTKMAALAADPAAEEAKLRASGAFEIPPLWYERPLYYKGNRFSFAGPYDDIVWPAYSNTVDYELELACVIGRRGRDISRDRAADHIFGYSVCNDLSARDIQAIEQRAPLGPAKGKDFDGGNVLGPCIVTSDAIDAANLEMVVRVNGIERARSSSSGMQHSFADIIAYVSEAETLHPGELLLSGCCGGGSAMELGLTCARGDSVELEIAGIGTIRNRII